MQYQVSFQPSLPYNSHDLPLMLISLEAWALVTISGADTIKYLQSQFTCDLASLKANSFSFAAHCNAQGKMLSNLCIFHRREGISYIERRSLRDIQIAELKKYAVFSNINIIADDQAVLLGLAGFQAPIALKNLFEEIPDASCPVVQQQDTTLLYYDLPSPRFLVITTLTQSNILQQKLAKKAKFNNSQQWLSLDIEAGYPIIDLANSAQFLPQAANLQILDGISFHKGCYTGQEMIARSQYRGANKRTLYWLVGKTVGDSSCLNIGNNVERKSGEHWYRTGSLLASCKLKDGSIWLQAILTKDLPPESILRVVHEELFSGTISIKRHYH